MANETMTYEQEMEYNIRGATEDAKKYKETILIVDSEVLNDYEFRLNWCTQGAREIFYPDHHQEYWKIVGKVLPDGTYINQEE